MTGEKIPPPPTGSYILDGNEMTLDELGNVLSTTIKHDRTTKEILCLGFLLNYTEEDQQNFAFNAPASTGKSFIALEVAKYFPLDDLMILSYTSPTAFFHTESVLVDKNLSPMPTRRDYVDDQIEAWEKKHLKPEKGEGVKDWREKRREEIGHLKVEWDGLEKYYLVDLERKIIIFLDQPHDELLKKLRPLLSHDQKLLQIKITDKSKEGGHRTKDVLIKGFPTVVFLSVNTSLDGQEKTRNFLLSPEVSQRKLRASIEQIAESQANRPAFKHRISEDQRRLDLMARVQNIRDASVKEVLIRPEDREYITNKFLREHNSLQPRHQRDFPRLISMIKGHALLNMFNREREVGKVWANRHDCDEGYQLYEEVSQANEYGVPPIYYKFWVERLQGELYEEGLNRKQLSALYLDFFKHRIGEKALKRLIEIYCEAGFTYEAKDPNDKRFIKIYPLGGGVENFSQVEDDTGQVMQDRARDLLLENEGSMGYREFFNKMNEYGYHNKDINNIVMTDLRFNADGFRVTYVEGGSP